MNRRPSTRIAAAFLAAGLAMPAAAATYTVDVAGPLDLGSVVAAAIGDTAFRINPASGAVTVQSGTGRRISGGSARAMVTVSCKPGRGADSRCKDDKIAIRVGTIGGLSGRARALANFTVSMGTATLATPPTGGSPLAFEIGPVGDNGSRTFYVGADFPVAGDDSGLPSGAGENGFYVYAVDNLGLNLAGDSDKGRVSSLRSLAVAKTSDMNFGRIQIPQAGASTVTLSAASGAVSVTGDAIAYATPAPSAAAFTVSGEGGQQVSISVPSTLSLSGPGTLTVNLASTATPAPTLSGALGGGGTYGFSVGGAFTLTPATPTGAYAGTITVTIDYN